MRSYIRGYFMTGLATLAVGVAITVPISFYTMKEVQRIVSEKLSERVPFETKAIDAYMAFKGGDVTQLSVLEAYAEKGLPQATSLLWQAYEDTGQLQARDQLMIDSMMRMDDPDLLFLMSYASSDEALILSTLDAEQARQLSACHKHLITYYGGDNGKIRIRYAYLSGLKRCGLLKSA